MPAGTANGLKPIWSPVSHGPTETQVCVFGSMMSGHAAEFGWCESPSPKTHGVPVMSEPTPEYGSVIARAASVNESRVTSPSIVSRIVMKY